MLNVDHVSFGEIFGLHTEKPASAQPPPHGRQAHAIQRNTPQGAKLQWKFYLQQQTNYSRYNEK